MSRSDGSNSSASPLPEPRLSRRTLLLGMGIGAGALLTNALALPRTASALTYRECLEVLGRSLHPGQRRELIWPADHPSRQIAQTATFLRRPHIGTLLTPEQLSIARRLFESMASEDGARQLAQPLSYEGYGFGASVLAFYGDPEDGNAHTLITGSHLALRGGGLSREGAAFGGPMGYGHLAGNGKYRLPGNAFAHHADAANRLYGLMDDSQRAASLIPDPPHELVVQVQDAGARFPGVRIGALGEAAQQAAYDLVQTVLSTYPGPDREDAFACIEHNGGVGALHAAFYESRGFFEDGETFSSVGREDRGRRPDPYWQVWRVEGPGTVIHFQGYPHVHAYVNVVRDPEHHRIGEVIAETDVLLEDAPLRALIESALRAATDEPHAVYPDRVPARFCPGPVTTGLAWALDPYGNHPAVATYRGEKMSPMLRDLLRSRGTAVEADREYRVATADYFTRPRDLLGSPRSVEVDSREIREVLVDHITRYGLRSTAETA